MFCFICADCEIVFPAGLDSSPLGWRMLRHSMGLKLPFFPSAQESMAEETPMSYKPIENYGIIDKAVLRSRRLVCKLQFYVVTGSRQELLVPR